MRDVIAGLAALALLVIAASLATTLKLYRKRRQGARDSERALGRTIIAEIPSDDDLVLFTEDAAYFYYGDRAVDKRQIEAVRVLINGSPIAAYESRRARARPTVAPTSFEDRPEGIARDRWDVAIECVVATLQDSQEPRRDRGVRPVVQEAETLSVVLVACGAIRERVSQELARAVFDAIRRDLERRD
jgi:hypothetical protein